MALICVMGAAAVAARTPWALTAVLLLNLTYYFLARLTVRDLWRDLRFLLLQILIVIGLYALKYGLAQGLWPGFRTGTQILLFFMPSVVLFRTTQGSRMMASLKRVMPPRTAFIIFTSLRFVPFFVREFQDIVMAQTLRGARLASLQWVDPRNWKDLFNCLMIPLIVRALKTADEAALSAEARGFRLQTFAPRGDSVSRGHTGMHPDPPEGGE